VNRRHAAAAAETADFVRRRSYTMARMAVKEGRRGGQDHAGGSGLRPEAVAAAEQLACVLEASADKPGNITPRHDFADTSYEDMLRSAIAIGPEIGRAAERGVGATVRAAVRATRRVTGANTNLGIALLLAPPARAALLGGASLRDGVDDVLGALTLADADAAYEAIRRAGAGGLDEPVEHDVRDAPAIPLREAMASAAGRDSVASEYASGFQITFDVGLPALRRALADGLAPRTATVEAFLALLAAVPDTLIARKRDRVAAERVTAEAASVLAAGGVRSEAGRAALAGFDAALRRDGNALNPGTTADLVTAALFVALLEGEL
jgi:triphosphoribosyl-dephospho-CoA synthase